MARFFKHVGEHNGKKVVIIEKSIPANAFLLGEGFKKISVLGLVTTLAVQPYKV